MIDTNFSSKTIISQTQLQYNNFERLKRITNNQIDINEGIEEGDTYYDGESLFPFIMVSLGLLEYYQREQLVNAIDTGVKIK